MSRPRRVPEGDKDAERYAMFLEYGGPDLPTLSLLANRYLDWYRRPEGFWEWALMSSGQAPCRDPLASLMRQPQGGSAAPSCAQLAACLWNPDEFRETPAQIAHSMEEMNTRGSCYLNLERDLGLGVCFFLGMRLSESHWTKILPKSDHKFEAVMTHIRERTMMLDRFPQCDFAALRNRIVQAKLNQIYRRPLQA